MEDRHYPRDNDERLQGGWSKTYASTLTVAWAIVIVLLHVLRIKYTKQCTSAKRYMESSQKGRSLRHQSKQYASKTVQRNHYFIVNESIFLSLILLKGVFNGHKAIGS